eukprot:1158620-Pelagomonas_calceolata.AAC.1
MVHASLTFFNGAPMLSLLSNVRDNAFASTSRMVRLPHSYSRQFLTDLKDKSNLPVFSAGGVPLVHKESFKYLGMWFHKKISMARSSQRSSG